MSEKRSAVSLLVVAASTLVGIALHEGYRGEAYIPVPGDRATIGFGSTAGVKEGDKTDPVRALLRLEKEIDGVYAAAVKRFVKVPLYYHEFSSYVNFTYQFGAENLRTSTMLAYLNVGEYGKACGQHVLWIYGPGKKPLPGLIKRAVARYLECVGE